VTFIITAILSISWTFFLVDWLHSPDYKLANHCTPLLKRFAKVNTDAIHIGHSGLDVHKELRRSTVITKFIFKTELKTAQVYEDMIENQGNNLKYELTGLPDTTISYDPDFAPWPWD